MNLRILQKKLRLIKQEQSLQISFKQFFEQQQIDFDFTFATLSDRHFKFLALCLKKQLRFVSELVLLLLAQDKSFSISGKVQRAIGKVYSQNQLKIITQLSSLNWDKLNFLDTYPALSLDHEFIQHSRMALMKIIYSRFHNGLLLPYLLHRYHNYLNYPTEIDKFWQKVPSGDIDISIEQLLSCRLPVWQNRLISNNSAN